MRVLEEGEASPMGARPGSEAGRSGFDSSKRLPAGFMQANGETLIMPSPIPKQGKQEKLEKRPSIETESSPRRQEKRREEERDKMQQELGEKRQALETSEAEKQSLLKMIQDLEKKVVVGGHGLDVQDRDQIIKQREIGLKLKSQKKKEKREISERLKREEELLLEGDNYQDLQEEVGHLRQVVKKLRVKYKQAANEIRDLQREHEGAKEELLDTIREQEKEMKWSNQVIKVMLSPHEVQKITQ